MKNVTTFRKDHEYIIVGSKSLETKFNKMWEFPGFVYEYNNPDNDPRGPYKAGSISRREDASDPHHKNYYTVTAPSGRKITRQWDLPVEDFKKFNKALRATDILWTKPSELSFYTALGLPIIIAPPIGSQEIFNRTWLRTIGAGASQYPPRYTNEWLFDWVESGWFAEAVMEGFIEAPKFGTYNIEKILDGKLEEVRKVVMTLQY